MSRNLVERSLPFVKREMLHAITINYNDNKKALSGIRNHITGFYQREYPELIANKMSAIDDVVQVAQDIYSRNVHLYMDLEWGTYPSYIHHRRGTGCFRCHNENLVDQEGEIIAFDCTTCHSILAYESDEKFKFIREPNPDDPDAAMHMKLHDEFFNGDEDTENDILEKLSLF